MRILKKFISYYKPYRKMFYFDMFCAILVSIIDLAFPQLLRGLTGGLYTREPEIILKSLAVICMGLLLMYVVRFLCQYYITSWGHIMGARMESDMRQDLFDQYQRLSFSYYDRNNTGEMMSKLISDLFDISELAHHGPENLLISLLKIIGSFALLLALNVRMTLILLSVTVLMAIYSIWLNKRMQVIYTENRQKIAGVNSRVQDSLSGIRVVKSFANEDMERHKFMDSNLQFLRSKERNYQAMGVFHAGNALFTGLLYTCVLVSGGYFIARGTLSAADLATFALYIGIFMNPVEVLINFTEQFQKGYAGFKRFLEVMDTVPEITDRPDAEDLLRVEGRITYENVQFGYETSDKEEEVLKDVSIDIKPGRTVALVGPSGGGKTTLCSLLPRFYDVSGGRVAIDGKDVRTLTLQSLRESIGIVQQDVYLFTGNIRENIAYGKPGASFEEIVAAAKRANIHEFVMSLPQGYETPVGERGARLSGGQKQRIAIARVFLKDPRILILDEATSALDNESERYIQQSLEELAADRTTIVIAHRLSTIRNADEIIVISEGQILERGTHDDLLTRKGLYASYYNMQFEDLDLPA
ncbi:MAG: ABC transporter ATP-binding protein [Provencibacterium sp.]|nr:ABC transporter ATP-binding protein [Provencibacterium sp.]